MNNMQESRPIEMPWDYDFGNVSCLFELAMDYVVRDAFDLKAANERMSNHMFLLLAHENAYDFEFHYFFWMNNDSLMLVHKFFPVASFCCYEKVDCKRLFDYSRESDNVNGNANEKGFHLSLHPHLLDCYDKRLWLFFWALTAVYVGRMQCIFALTKDSKFLNAIQCF